MKRLKLSRQEKLLFLTPLLPPLLVMVWPMVSVNGLDRTLHDLAGPQAIDCGDTPNGTYMNNPCVVAAFKAGQPFIIRLSGLKPSDPPWGMVRTAEEQNYLVRYSRKYPTAKASLTLFLCPSAELVTDISGQPSMRYNGNGTQHIGETRVWW